MPYPIVPILVGMAGTSAMALGATSPAYSFSPYGWGENWVEWLGRFATGAEGVWETTLGALALTWAWWVLRPRKGQPLHGLVNMPGTVRAMAGAAGADVHDGMWSGIRQFTWALILWCLPMLALPPILSNDSTLYADAGWSYANGYNVYDVGLAYLPGPYHDQVDKLWAGSGVAYPPLSILTAWLCDAVTGFHPYWGIIAQRIPVLISVAVMLYVLPRLAHSLMMTRFSEAPGLDCPSEALESRACFAARLAVWLGVLNPLLIVHYVGGAHNDAPMVAITVVALYMVVKKPTLAMSLVYAPIVVGLGMAYKPQGGLTAVAVAALPVIFSAGLDLQVGNGLMRLRRAGVLKQVVGRVAVACCVTLATFALVCVVSGLGFGWTKWLDLMGKANTIAPMASIPKLILLFNGEPPWWPVFTFWWAILSAVVLLGLLLFVLIRFADRPISAVGWGAFVVVVAGQSIHPWYLPWTLALLGLAPHTRTQRRWLFGFAIVFFMWNTFQTAMWHGQYVPEG
ncbi:MAG: hypothetical protein LBR21_09230 [Propionibacteriaceae bacterium]|jgi:hypothetical protein|nr:hypothetical protein [Propionibacteriaceae bacterium]